MIIRRSTQKSKRRAARRGTRRLRMESLEKRLQLAGNVTAALFGSSLVITGDVDDNDITLDGDALAGRVNITPNGTTTLNGTGASQVFQTRGGIRLQMRDGNDTVDFNGLGGSTPGSLMVNLGDGNNVFSLDDYTLGRSLYVRNGGGFDNLNLTNVSAFNMSINNGDGGSGTIVQDSTIANVMITNGDGFDHIGIHSSDIDGRVVIRNGDGENVILLWNSSVGDDVVITNGDGFAYIQISAADVGDDVMISNGVGFHDLNVQTATVGGDVRIRNGAGGGMLQVLEADIAGNLYNMNADAAHTMIYGSSVGGNIYNHDGAGQGSFRLQQSDVGGAVRQSSRDGDYIVEVVSSTVGGYVSAQNGNGDNVVSIIDSSVSSNVNISNRNGDNTTTFSGGVDVDGRVSIRNGNGDNTIRFDDADIALDVLVQNRHAINGNTMAFGTVAPVTIGRNLQLRSGNGGSTTTLNAVNIGRNLFINSGNGVDNIIATGTALGDLTVGNVTSICTNGGEDNLQLGTDVAGLTQLSARVTVYMGAGADTAVIGEGTVIDILSSILGGGYGAGVDVLTVTNGTAFDPTDPANLARLRNWELIVTDIAPGPVSTDPFDSSQGTVVVNHDTIIDPINAFRTSGGFGDGQTLMRNGGLNSLSFIEFDTASPVSIVGVRLFASNDLPSWFRRSMNHFTLLADTDDDSVFETVVVDVDINPNYQSQPGNNATEINDLDLTLLAIGIVTAQHWRLEVTQGTDLQPFEGARLVELDAIPPS